jgi:phosphopantothenate-cysteine ligase/phosphopantothenoylcysteine decarboxylase/phosphopantothenate--cysteine ligase
MRCLVTAGSTREMIDAVRCWSNIFTGNTGLAIAQSLAQIGPVDLLSSNPNHLTIDLPNLNVVGFNTHARLRELLEKKMNGEKYDAVFMTAAVSDYKPAGVYAIVSQKTLGDGQEQWIVRSVQAEKVKSTHSSIAVAGKPTEKLIDLFRNRWNHRGLLVKFKLEVGLSHQELIEVGQASRKQSGAEYLVANTLDMVSGPDAGAYLLSDQGSQWIPRDQLPQHMADIARQQDSFK